MSSAGTGAYAVVGQRLADRYQIEGVIGQGSFGRVYRALDVEGDRVVALKEFVRQPGQPDSFLRELGILFELHHPHVISCHSLVMGGRVRYLVCEYMDGGSLRDLLESGRATADELTRLLLQVCDGVAYAHERNVIHRDLKPENILLSLKPRKRGAQVALTGTSPDLDLSLSLSHQAKVSDFGISTLGTSAGLRSSIGSPAYMAPEQFYEQYDARVDIYALGVMLYEIIVGRRPFVGSPAQLMRSHIRSEPEIPEWVPKMLSRLLRKSLAKKPDRRYSSIESFREALRLALAAEGHTLDAVQWPLELGEVLEVGHVRDEVLVRRPNDVLRFDRVGRLVQTQPAAERLVCAEGAYFLQRGETVFVSTPIATRVHRALPSHAEVSLAADGTLVAVAEGKATVIDAHGRHALDASRRYIEAACFVGREQTLCLAFHEVGEDGETRGDSFVSFSGSNQALPFPSLLLYGNPQRYEVIARAATSERGGDGTDIAMVRATSTTRARVEGGDFSCDGETFFSVTADGELASVNVATERIARTRWESKLCCISASRDRFIWATRHGRVLCT